MPFVGVRTVVIASVIIVLAWLTVTLTEERKKKNQKVVDLPILTTYRSGTLAMLSSKFKGPLLMEALDNASYVHMEAFD